MGTSIVFSVLPTALLVLSLVIMASQTLTLVRAKPQGKVEQEFRMGFLQRALAQRTNVMGISAVIILGGGAFGVRWLPPILTFIAIGAMLGMLLKPQRVVLTSAGVMPNPAVFRRWKDFDSYQVIGSRIVLRSSTRLASTNLYVSSKRRPEMERAIGRHLRKPRPSAGSKTRARGRRATSTRRRAAV